ncbi:hypothetical protein M0R04_15345 [Candidatus Dojkabacteria bacterium]|jgi:hypothetical protein|nr:hypothetical protein [Candidatus Dojkabacteria bacterium]
MNIKDKIVTVYNTFCDNYEDVVPYEHFFKYLIPEKKEIIDNIKSLLFSLTVDENLLSYSKCFPGKIIISIPTTTIIDSFGQKVMGKKQVTTTFGRYIRKYKKIDEKAIPSHILTAISNHVIATAVDTEKIISLVQGDEIENLYKEHFAYSSCMSGDSARYTRLYANNPDKVSLLCLRFGDITGRALVWETEEKVTVVDRIYPNSGVHIDMIREFAQSRGWKMRSHNGSPDNYGSDKNIDGKTYYVKLKNNTDYFPYSDTFRYLTSEYPYIILTNDRGGPDVIGELSHVDGTYHTYEEDYRCNCCGNRVCEDDICYSEDGDAYCQCCFDKCYSICDRCNRTIYTYDTPLNEIRGCKHEYVCDYCAEKLQVRECEHCGEKWEEDNLVMAEDINGDEYYYCVDCYTDVCQVCAQHSPQHTPTIFDGREIRICPDCLLVKKVKNSKDAIGQELCTMKP